MPTIPVPPEVQMRIMLYYANASRDTKEKNVELALPLIRSWGVVAIKSGISTMIEHLLANQMIAWRGDYLSFILNISLKDINLLHDMVHADGIASTVHLMAIIANEENEDIRALAAYLMVSTSFEFDHSSMADDLRKAYAGTIGTGCRIALALAISQCGDSSQINSLIQQGFVGNGSAAYYESMKLRAPSSAPDATKAEIEQSVALLYTAPELVMDEYDWSLIGMLALDIAMNGNLVGPMKTGARPWVRKH